MQLYLDSANLDHIKEVASWGILSGVTTNPSLIAKEDPTIDVKARILEIHNIVGGHLSVEVLSMNAEGMIKEAEEICEWFPLATIKIPMCVEGLKAVKELSKRNIPTNVTLIFNPIQALAANNAGASYVSIFMGRLDDIGMNSVDIISEISEIWYAQTLPSQIIAASIRNPLHIVSAAKLGIHIATVPYNVLKQGLKHPLTDIGIQQFLDDHNKMLNSINKSKS
ncbi:fructose-6-phosphate aldolase [bacterium]|nr:fructose-6-phosphate aldolase [bacterium]